MDIHSILYNTTRSIYSVEDKLSIATIILFCYKNNNKQFSELLYTDDHLKFIERLENEYKEYGLNFHIKLGDKNIRQCFYKTLEKVKEKYDKDEFYKAIFNKDKYALVICDVVNFNFKSFDKVTFSKEVSAQLSFW